MRTGLAAVTPTFNDVPVTHPYFEYIEQMKARGITAGCSLDPPRFCPEDPATRGQVAAFLMRAIGPGATASAPDPDAKTGLTIMGHQISPFQAIGGLLIIAALLRR